MVINVTEVVGNVASQEAILDESQFSDFIRYIPTTIAILTTDGPHGKRGITLSACVVLSYDPASFICGLRKKEANEIFIKNKTCGLNILDSDQEELAKIFGGKTQECQSERFSHDNWFALKTGAPILTKSYVSFDCEISEIFDQATHYLVVLKIVAVKKPLDNQKILLHGKGHYLSAKV